MAKKKRKKTLADLEPQADPRADLDSQMLLEAAGPVLKTIEADLLARAKASPALTRGLSPRHAADKESRFTAGPAGTTCSARRRSSRSTRTASSGKGGKRSG